MSGAEHRCFYPFFPSLALYYNIFSGRHFCFDLLRSNFIAVNGYWQQCSNVYITKRIVIVKKILQKFIVKCFYCRTLLNYFPSWNNPVLISSSFHNTAKGSEMWMWENVSSQKATLFLVLFPIINFVSFSVSKDFSWGTLLGQMLPIVDEESSEPRMGRIRKWR